MSAILLGKTVETAAAIGFGGSAAVAAGGRDILYTQDAGLVTVAGTGAGKGVSHVVPAALSWPGSLIVIDIKGEIAEIAAARRRAMGQKVVVLDPFGVSRFGKLGHGFNPLDLIGANAPTAIDDTLSLADQFRSDKGSLSDPFWDDRARDIIAGAMLFVATHAKGEQRSLATVHRIFTGGEDKLAAALAGMKASAAHGGYLNAVVEQVLAMPDKTWGSVLTTIHSQLEFLASPVVVRSVSAATVTPRAITENDPISLFLVLPPERLTSHRRLLRLWLATALTSMTRRRRIPAMETLVLADEAAQLGRMDLLLTAASLMRGYGVRLWTFWQSLGQLETLYGDAGQSFIDNAGAVSAFGVANAASAGRVAELTGWAGPLLGLPVDRQVLALRGQAPFLARRVSYLEEPRFRGQYDANPMHRFSRSGRKPHASRRDCA